MSKKLIHELPELGNIPVNIKLVKEGKIDVENIQEGLEHKLFYQNVIRGVVACKTIGNNFSKESFSTYGKLQREEMERVTSSLLLAAHTCS